MEHEVDRKGNSQKEVVSGDEEQNRPTNFFRTDGMIHGRTSCFRCNITVLRVFYHQNQSDRIDGIPEVLGGRPIIENMS